MDIKEKYLVAKQMYQELGIDTDLAIENLKQLKISIHCWQGDDVGGFFFKDNKVSGGIQVTGNYPGKAKSIKELQEDLEFVLKLIPGKHKVNLHAIYMDNPDNIDLDQIEPKHFKNWVTWAKKNDVGLDFNPTLFGHPTKTDGLTLSHPDKKIREFWIKHCIQSRKIAKYFGKELNQKSVLNIWIPDGYKDFPVDRLSPRQRLKESLDIIYSEKTDNEYIIDTVESKVFGIGLEGYTVGSHEFYLGYAAKNNIGLCLDSGHFHPTENMADKISSTLLYVDELLVHVSRPMRWDSDHVVSLDDQVIEIAREIIWNGFSDKVHLGLDFFDASINRIAAWTIGVKNFQKALLYALLSPIKYLQETEEKQNYTDRLYMLEMLKSYPFGIVYEYYCSLQGKPGELKALEKIREYERETIKR